MKAQPSSMSIDVEGDAINPEPEWSNEDEYWAWEAKGYTDGEIIYSEYSAESSSDEDINQPRISKRLQHAGDHTHALFQIVHLILFHG